MRKICFATNNIHKIKELNALLGVEFELQGLKEIGCFVELPETSATIEANSVQKADYVFEHYKVSCFADDTGLEVDALNGAPGVFSARYAGVHGDAEANMKLLLKNLDGVANRKARFKTVITYINPKGEQHQFEGIVNGQIIESGRGGEGFGYDPIFIPDGYEETFAEMPLSLKNQISHRALAVRKLIAFLKSENV